MTDLLEQLADFLEASGHGTKGMDIFKGQLPETPIESLAVISTGGPRDEGNPTRWPSFAVHIRSARISTGDTKSRAVHTSLAGHWNVLASIQGRIHSQHEPGIYDRDEKTNHFTFPLNFMLETVDP
jgi:hypothetical protein